jgi:hypothetical protein
VTHAATTRGSGGPQRAKGSTARSTLASLERQLGEGGVAAVLDTLPPPVRDAVGRAAPTDDLPYPALVALWEAVDRALHGHPAAGDAWHERAGEEAIRSAGMRLYGGILRKATPHAFLTQSISLFQLFYAPGDMEVVVEQGTRAVLRLVGFDPVTPRFCARLTGGLRESIRQAGGQEAQVAHVRCTLVGDAFCEWALQWAPSAPVTGGADDEALARDA